MPPCLTTRPSLTGSVVRGPPPTLWRWCHPATSCWLTWSLTVLSRGLASRPCIRPSPSLQVIKTFTLHIIHFPAAFCTTPTTARLDVFTSAHTQTQIMCYARMWKYDWCSFQLKPAVVSSIKTTESSAPHFTPASILLPWTASGPSRFATLLLSLAPSST